MEGGGDEIVSHFYKNDGREKGQFKFSHLVQRLSVQSVHQTAKRSEGVVSAVVSASFSFPMQLSSP